MSLHFPCDSSQKSDKTVSLHGPHWRHIDKYCDATTKEVAMQDCTVKNLYPFRFSISPEGFGFDGEPSDKARDRVDLEDSVAVSIVPDDDISA